MFSRSLKYVSVEKLRRYETTDLLFKLPYNLFLYRNNGPKWVKKTEVGEFHNHINDIEACIKFTIEHERNNFIPFLDVCVTRKASGELMTKIYKEPTHTNRYLNFYSAHSMRQKQGLIKCLLKRAQLQFNSKQVNNTLETSKIMEALKQMIIPNGF